MTDTLANADERLYPLIDEVNALCDPLSESMSDGHRLTALIQASGKLTALLDKLMHPSRPAVGILPFLTDAQRQRLTDAMRRDPPSVSVPEQTP